MSTIRQTQTPLLERRAKEINELRAEVAALKTRIAELETELEVVRKK